MELFVSDIHGNFETFSRILNAAPADAHLHMVGDVYDRGPEPDAVVDALESWPNVDIQWGNHDILWMGAALGQVGCVANVVRICARYGNLDVLESTYGMDLGPLRAFALDAYGSDPCAAFGLKGSPDLPSEEVDAQTKVQKAMAYIQFKVEHALIAENTAFELGKRDLLHRVDHAAATVEVDGVVYPLKDPVFPTVDPDDPYALTQGEREVVEHLCNTFKGCEKLQRHVRVLVDRGSLYKRAGDVLLFHACVPMNADGTLLETSIFGAPRSGQALFDAVDRAVRDAFSAPDAAERKRGADMLWYLWLGPASPLFAKSKMATFELYQVEDKAARTEAKNPFYRLLEDPATAEAIFADFGMDPDTARIVCGHVPVKVKDGENPVKCGGKLVCIDGGMARAYQPTTGIGGFVLVRDDAGMRLGTLPPSNELDAQGAPTAGSLDGIATWREL